MKKLKELLFECNGCNEKDFTDNELFECPVCKESYCEDCFDTEHDTCFRCAE